MKLLINASHWKTMRDHEDEVTLVFKVPMSDADKVIAIPNNKNLVMSLELGYVKPDGTITKGGTDGS